MQGLDRYVCGECRDEGGGSRLRDFIHHLAVSAWDNAFDAVVASGSGSTLRYTARLPEDRPKQPRHPDPSREAECAHLGVQRAERRRWLEVDDARLQRSREAVRPRPAGADSVYWKPRIEGKRMKTLLTLIVVVLVACSGSRPSRHLLTPGLSH